MDEPIQYISFDEYPVYEGADLGVTYEPSGTSFRLWSPTAQEVRIKLYAEGLGGDPLETHAMKRAEQGTWTLRLKGDQAGKFYTCQVMIDSVWLGETPGPYAKAVGVNGDRGYILDFDTTDPKGWASDAPPPLERFNDIVIYELHIRDMSIHPSAGITHRGKYLGLTEEGTKSPDGLTTGLDHLEEIGITHVHILPMYDYGSIDETKLEENNFNWGYEPKNYNAPEGSYATDPYNPASRIRELKMMVKSLHDKGIRVVMDVVYNHTGFGDANNFNMSLAVPGYYYRQRADGTLSDASACGNETASERPMMRKYILESVKYWAEEYHIDGFRFDLMGIHDIETMNAVSAMLHEMDSTIFIYGEGWKAGDSPLPDEQLALKKNVPQLNSIAAFSDEIRDGIKGSWHDWEAPGFVSGNADRIEGVKFGFVGGVDHPEIDYGQVPESDAPWAPAADQCMVYVSCHDNHTLYDKLKVVNPDAPEEDILKMHVLANTIVLTSQGIPFLHAGVDFVRTKQGVENSYKSPDSINQIDWNRKKQYIDIFSFYKEMIALRKTHPAFKLNTQPEIAKRIDFYDAGSPNVLAYTLDSRDTGDSFDSWVMIFNGGGETAQVAIPEGAWSVIVEGTNVNDNGIREYSGALIAVPAYSGVVLARSISAVQ